jgi:putative transposase
VTCYRIVLAEKARTPVSVACELLGVSTSGFYTWGSRAPSDRELSDAWLIERIRHIHVDNRQVYGSRRVTAELRLGEGVVVSRKRVQRLMRQAGLSGVVARKRGRTTIRVPGVRVADDLVERRFRPVAPDVLWVADITYLRTWEGWLYLAAIQDAYSRRIVGWSMADHMRSELVVDALQMALHRRRPGPGLVHHSDQGSQPGLNRSSQRCVRELNLGTAGDGRTGVLGGDSVGVARLSSRRLARRAGRSGDSRVRAVRVCRGRGPASPCWAAVSRTPLRQSRIVSCRRLRPPLPGAR